MYFATLIFITAFLMEAIGSYISVVGLSSLSTDIVILLLAVVLDVAKIVSVSLLYKFWDRINFITKTYLIPAVFVTMLITTAGAYGYLRETFQKAVLPNQEAIVLIEQLQQRHAQLDERIKAIDIRRSQIDEQISKIPDVSVRGKKQLISAFDPEKRQLTEERIDLSKELIAVDKKIPELKSSNAKTDNHIGGPVVAVAETFNITKETAIKIVSAIIVAIFDPLAIVLILMGNHAARIAADEKRKAPIEKIKKELEQAKWLHEAEKQKVAYQAELDTLKTANESAIVEEPIIVDNQNVVEEPTPIVEPDATPLEDVRKTKRSRKQKPKNTDEPKPIVINEKDLLDVLNGIAQGLDTNESPHVPKPQPEYGIIDAEVASDDAEQKTISGNIMDARHSSDHFADHSKDAHEDHVNFYKSNLPPTVT